MPEPLEAIAAQITALSETMNARFESMDARFVSIDARFTETEARFDQRLAEMGAQLGVKIEAVDEKVTRVYDAVLAFQAHSEANDKAHAEVARRLDNHDLRILALERSKPTNS